MVKIIESIKFDGTNLNDIFKLECVHGIYKSSRYGLMVILKGGCTKEIHSATKGDYICKLSNGMWQVFGQEVYMNEIKK